MLRIRNLESFASGAAFAAPELYFNAHPVSQKSSQPRVGFEARKRPVLDRLHLYVAMKSRHFITEEISYVS